MSSLVLDLKRDGMEHSLHLIFATHEVAPGVIQVCALFRNGCVPWSWAADVIAMSGPVFAAGKGGGDGPGNGTVFCS